MANERRKRLLLATLAITIALSTLGFLALGDLEEQLVYYWTPSELLENGNRGVGASVRLGGLVESIEWGSEPNELRFRLTDGAASIPVHASAVPPAMFREGIGVVVEGRLGAGGVFETRRLMVKHDNEYRPPGEEDARSLKEQLQALTIDGGEE